MTFSEAFEKAGYGIGTEVTIRGFLVATQSFAYLSESEAMEREASVKAIMVVWPSLADALLEAHAPVRVGSMVLFAGEAEVTGILNKSGMGLAPIAIHTVKKLKYWHEGEEFEVQPKRQPNI